MRNPRTSPVASTLALVALYAATLSLAACRPSPRPTVPGPTLEMPEPRPVDDAERAELEELLERRFGRRLPADAEIAAAGPYRFIHSAELTYIDRTDTGSVAFELTAYGIGDDPLDPATIQREVLLPRIDAALERTGLRLAGRTFDAFDDEFAGAAAPESLPPDFDPRRASVHVGRTAAFARQLEQEIPVFGSELIVGLMPDGTIGRLRSHWPGVSDGAGRSAADLRELVASGKWQLPEAMRQPGVEVLETAAGVAQTGFAAPGLRQAAVVRVLYRQRADTEPPLVATGYRYFDAEGREVRLAFFPQLAGSRAGDKGK
jgi:hypothetical protein